MKNSWKYWGPFPLFIIASIFAWIIMRTYDLHYDVLIWTCGIILIVGIILFMIALIPLFIGIREHSRKKQTKDER